ncbi:MAG: hypothetical protein FWG85_07575 [Bacteroidetes bacterium]|nr:hypothetical protein [Bacteroidota bacterium]
MKKYITLFAIILAIPNLNAQFVGDGSSSNPYQIRNKTELENLADSVNTIDNWSSGIHFKVMNNITAPVTKVIGTPLRPFQGNFNGQGYTINLAIDKPSDEYVGLFGNVYYALIENVIIRGFVNGGQAVGGIVGYSRNLTIKNCINTGTVYGNLVVGAIVGLLSFSSTTTDCINTGNITGNGDVGGIVGIIYNYSLIENCINVGSIYGISQTLTDFEDHIGGIAGCIWNNSVISHCANYGHIRGNFGAGGIVRHLGDESITTIKSSFNVGVVEGPEIGTGAIIGSESD